MIFLCNPLDVVAAAVVVCACLCNSTGPSVVERFCHHRTVLVSSCHHRTVQVSDGRRNLNEIPGRGRQ